MPFLDEIAARLAAAGVGVPGMDIFMSSSAKLPAGPGPYMTLKDTGGTGPTRIHNQAHAATQRPTAQITVRASTYTTARSMAQAAYAVLDGVFNTTLSGVMYLSITARQEPTDLGLDDMGRSVVVFNIDAEKAPS